VPVSAVKRNIPGAVKGLNFIITEDKNGPEMHMHDRSSGADFYLNF
jgi:hypothetical protein